MRRMRTLYQAANAVEAHILQGYLQQEGLSVQVLGGYLQGGIGELPASGFVRLMVEDDQYETARAAIARWEAARPASADD